jgi:hypothetical protein
MEEGQLPGVWRMGLGRREKREEVDVKRRKWALYMQYQIT